MAHTESEAQIPPQSQSHHVTLPGETAGAFGDIGTFAPLAVTLISVNGLNPTMVFGIAGCLYLYCGIYYRLPIPVQPLKSLSALAIALGVSSTVVGAAGLIMGVSLLIFGLTGLAGLLAKLFTRPLVRGIQLGVGIILVRTGAGMISNLCLPSDGSYLADVHFPAWTWNLLLAAPTGGILLALLGSRKFPAGVLVVLFGIFSGLLINRAPALGFGPVIPTLIFPNQEELWQALFWLALPQLPLTLTNSVVATKDTAVTYFGSAASRVTARALTMGLGLANLVAGMTSGMPVCHGSGGLTAHYRFGARSGLSVMIIGSLLIVIALAFGPSAVALCQVLPAPVLGVLLVYVGGAHALLVRDVQGFGDWAIVLATGVLGGITGHNGYGLAAGLFVLAIVAAVRFFRRKRN